MKANIKTRGLAINLILSVAISLIVNFSYFVMMILSSSIAGAQGGKPRYNPAEFPGFLTLEIVYYIVLAFILLVILTAKDNENKINSGSYWKRPGAYTHLTLPTTHSV